MGAFPQPTWVHSSQSPLKEETFPSCGQRMAGFQVEAGSQESGTQVTLGKLGKTENRCSPGDPRKEHSPADALILAQGDPGQTSAVEL